jgi:hypothetical protein
VAGIVVLAGIFLLVSFCGGVAIGGQSSVEYGAFNGQRFHLARRNAYRALDEGALKSICAPRQRTHSFVTWSGNVPEPKWPDAIQRVVGASGA